MGQIGERAQSETIWNLNRVAFQKELSKSEKVQLKGDFHFFPISCFTQL